MGHITALANELYAALKHDIEKDQDLPLIQGYTSSFFGYHNEKKMLSFIKRDLAASGYFFEYKEIEPDTFALDICIEIKTCQEQ